MSKKLGPWRVESVCRLGEVESANGFQIMDGDDVLVDMFEGNGYSRARIKKILNLMAASLQMKADLEAFLWHWDRIDTPEDAVNLCKDMAVLFRQSLRTAEGKR